MAAQSAAVQVKAGVIAGLNGQVHKQDVEPLVLELPREFLNLCSTHGVSPAAALRGFIAGVCALENRIYGWNRIDAFFRAWPLAGVVPVGHIVWQKNYSSSRSYLQARHE